VTFLRHAFAILVLPFTVTAIVPAIALIWRGTPYVRIDPLAALVTAVVALIPLAFVAWTIGLFAVTGRGTLAPWDPTEKLVVRGPYRHVRNPMILGVMGILIAEAVITRSGVITIELALFVLANTTYIPIREERALLERFGEEYETYARNVPRWAPRLTAWDGKDDGVPRRSPDDLVMVQIPIEHARGLVTVFVLAVLALVVFLGMAVWSAVADGPSLIWVMLAGAVAWALLDLRDAWVDAFRDPPPPQVFGRMHPDGKTFELREEPDSRPVAGWRFVRRDKGTFVLMRKRLVSRGLVKGLRPKHRPFRMAVLYEPQGKPDDDGWIRYPASAAWEDPPGEWRPVKA
jgi:protein-S-isoprenylcysteine O-methyltransferase Ste14